MRKVTDIASLKTNKQPPPSKLQDIKPFGNKYKPFESCSVLLLDHLLLMLWNYSTDFPNPHWVQSYYLRSTPVYWKKIINKKKKLTNGTI